MKILLILGLALLLWESALTNVIFVPDDYLTIQVAINYAENGDSIIVSPGTYYENIELHYKNLIIGSFYLITQDESYIAQTVINGEQDDYVLEIRGGSSYDNLITGFTITGGDAIVGGGIYCYGADYTFSHLVISDNHALHYGGGFYCRSGSNINLENVVIEGNFCDEKGGGISVSFWSIIIMDNVMIRNNEAINGGGIYCDESLINMNNSTIRDNRSHEGAGIKTYESDCYLYNSKIVSNNASNSGGGMYINRTDAHYSNVLITGNTAESQGGGLCIMSFSTLRFDPVNRCNIYFNNINSRTVGNDISSYVSIDVIVDTFTVVNPGTIHAAPLENFYFDILNGKLQQVNADLYVSPEGDNNNSGLSAAEPLRTIRKASLMIIGDSLETHTIHLAEGIYSADTNDEFFPVGLPDYIILQGDDRESVILDAGGTARVIWLDDAKQVTISELTVRNGADRKGAGICIFESTANLTNLIISGNLAEEQGGGLYSRDSDVIIDNVIVEDNSSELMGGGIYCSGDNSIQISNTTIRGNSAIFGAGMRSNSCQVTLTDVLFAENEGNSSGGGFFAEYADPVMNRVTFINNTAHYGGGIYCMVSSPLLKNVTLTGNAAESDGGGIFCINDCHPIIINSIFWNDLPNEIHFSGNLQNDVTLIYNNIVSGEEGVHTNQSGTVNWLEGNIYEDPLFTEDHHLWGNSLCIDAGIAYFEYEGEVLIDLSEDEYFGSAPDMGAFEHDPLAEDKNVIDNGELMIENYPNPFNPSTRIVFEIPEEGDVELGVYNLKGQRIRELKIENVKCKIKSAIWDGKDDSGRQIASGVYLLRLRAGEQVIVKKVMLMK
ncbi:MAG: T9SS type A sorting domain-containing protein [Candidatus Cloacimonetes bacterium]|nr:T9SS type A sorting domain-containing protein [Candidatus Cloacimonadota bacterium]